MKKETRLPYSKPESCSGPMTPCILCQSNDSLTNENYTTEEYTW